MRRWVLIGVVAILCVALVAVETFLRKVPTEHKGTSDEDSLRMVVSSTTLGKVRAALEREGQGPVEHVLPSVGGAIAIVEDGLVAVDPKTGEQRWSYRLPGTEVAASVAPLDTTNADVASQQVVLTHNTPSLLGSRGHTITLDALTGEEKQSAWHSTQDPPTDRMHLLTQDTWIVPRGNRTLEAFSLETGRSAWEYQAPQGCQIDMPTNNETVSGVVTMQTQVVAAWHCPDEKDAQAVSLDSATGEEKWIDPLVAGNRGTPLVRTMDATALANTGQPHPARAIARGELEHYYVLLDENGALDERLWKRAKALTGYIQPPVAPPPDTTDPPDIVVGHSDEIEYSLRLHVIAELLDQGVLNPDDIYEEYWVDGPDDEQQLIENRAGRMIGPELIEQAVKQDPDE